MMLSCVGGRLFHFFHCFRTQIVLHFTGAGANVHDAFPGVFKADVGSGATAKMHFKGAVGGFAKGIHPAVFEQEHRVAAAVNFL